MDEGGFFNNITPVSYNNNEYHLGLIMYITPALLVLVLVVSLIILVRLFFSPANKESAAFEKTLREELARMREEDNTTARNLREEVAGSIRTLGESLRGGIGETAALQKTQLEFFSSQISNLTGQTERRLEEVRRTFEEKMRLLQEENGKKLELIRSTVDERLHATLEQRLGESFKSVSERLEQVHQGLGEMRALAAGVGDLKKILANVKTRGMWGEVQLGTLLEQFLTPEQFERNVATKKGSADRVEFAIRLPGRDEKNGPVWLPIDAKFPVEDYQRLLEAQEQADATAMDERGRQLETAVKNEAKQIREKYLDPPHTTDFALLFLPVEGLYAEVLRRTGLIEILQREYRVVVAGPSTLAALLNSLQMGFRTLVIEKRSSEVWSLLRAVKTDFGRFQELLEKTQKKLNEAADSIDDAVKKTRTIDKKLRNVQELPVEETAGPVDAQEQLDGM